ncbi:MAG: glycerol-3-phosphate 1-O-acyltransferase PlsY [candidate division Zixibacteria bacterium]|nr:glycerol-3-phosphate 1-O-acyltransferase PlsY [candidate division Zixibacteria bacterium]
MTYLIGAIPFGIIISRLFGIKDIRNEGSGNIGAANVWRVAGFKAAVWVFIADIGKGAVAILMAEAAYNNLNLSFYSLDLFLAICGAAVVIGHIFPVFLKFKGGKGANTTLGVAAALLPIHSLICVAVFVTVVMVTKYVSLGSIIGAAVLSLSLAFEKFILGHAVSNVYLVMTSILTVLVIFAHRQNISRIISGNEKVFSFSAKAGSDR